MINCVRRIARILHIMVPHPDRSCATSSYTLDAPGRYTHQHTMQRETSQDEFWIAKSIQIVSAIFLSLGTLTLTLTHSVRVSCIHYSARSTHILLLLLELGLRLGVRVHE